MAATGLALLALLVVVGEHARFYGRVGRIAIDEGYIGAFAMAMIRGSWLPYVDAVSHRGPVLYWMAALAQAAFGDTQWAGIRLLSAASAAATVFGCFAIGLSARRPTAGAIAAASAAYILVVAFDPSEGAALDGELLGVCFLVFGLLAATQMALIPRTPRTRNALGAAAGALCALAALTKQTLVLGFFPVLALIALAAIRKRRKSLIGELAWAAVGFAGPIAAVVGIYAVRAKLGALWYWIYRYNYEIYMGPYRGQSWTQAFGKWLTDAAEARIVLFCLLAAVAAAALAALLELRRWGSIRTSSTEPEIAEAPELDIAVCLLAIASIVGAVAPLRFFTYYFVGTAPWLALLAGLRTDRFFGLGKLSRTAAALAGMGGYAVLLVFGYQSRMAKLDSEFARGSWHRPEEDPICEAIASATNEGEPILVWGHDGDVYVSCNRPPATKYVFSSVVMGVVPPFWTQADDRWVVPGARDDAASEIRTRRPPLILDDSDVFGGRRIGSVPELRAAMEGDYCAPRTLVGTGPRRWQIYVRKDRGCDRLAKMAPLEDERSASVTRAPSTGGLFGGTKR